MSLLQVQRLEDPGIDLSGPGQDLVEDVQVQVVQGMELGSVDLDL